MGTLCSRGNYNLKLLYNLSFYGFKIYMYVSPNSMVFEYLKFAYIITTCIIQKNINECPIFEIYPH